MNTTIEYILEVHSVSPLLGSLMGGTRLTITGSGFSNDTAHNQVFFGSSHGKTQTPVVQQAGGISPEKHALAQVSFCFILWMEHLKEKKMFMHIWPSFVPLYWTISLPGHIFFGNIKDNLQQSVCSTVFFCFLRYKQQGCQLLILPCDCTSTIMTSGNETAPGPVSTSDLTCLLLCFHCRGRSL